MRRLWRFASRHGLDVVVALGAIGTALDVAVRYEAAQPTTAPWLAVLAAAALWLPLFARRRWPFGAPAVVWLLGAAVSVLDGRLMILTAGATAAGLVASFLLGQVTDVLRARAGLVVALVGTAIVVAGDPNHAPADFVFVPLPFAIAWLAGLALAERTARAAVAEERARRAERERAAAARIAVAEERARIARELHDIVAHAVSVLVLQIGAVRHTLPDTQSQEKDALAAAERTGRSALTEMRRLLGAMRGAGDGAELAPQPRLRDLPHLLDDVRRAGLPVDLAVAGQPYELPEGLELSAYRIVQEGLTNALKHARASHADVLLGYQPQQLTVTVRDDGTASSDPDGSGHGLIGLRERVRIYGGELTAGAAAGGGYVLRARLPVGGGLR